MKLRLNLTTASTTTMPPDFIDIIHRDVSAVVLVFMLFTKVVPVRILIIEKLNYFMTSLPGKMKSRLNLTTACTTTMPPELIDITHWDVSAVVLVLMLFTKWGLSNHTKSLLTDGRTDGRTDGNRQSNSRVGYTQPA